MDIYFNEDAIEWMRKKGFSEAEIEEARRAISIAWKHVEAAKGETLILPKGTSGKVAALVYAVLSNTDIEGRPLGFQKGGLVDVTDEARKSFDEEAEIGEFEDVLERISKIKIGRGRSDPRRRTSVIKKERHL